MNNKCKKIALCLFLLAGTYNLWTLRPVKILYAYSDFGSTVFLVVDHLPWTDRDKIRWYLTHREEFKRKYPLLDQDWFRYYVIDIGNGFTNAKNYHDGPYEDLYCFPTIKDDADCIVKDYLFIVDEYSDSNTTFGVTVIDGEHEYQLTPEKQIERVFYP
ncbi:DUF943 domain-containing protein [Salmonella enterica subsp. diarizonae]|uniref:DUF943 domain-containing protein n=3 Tax=Salmonella enterica TaxID=28901 RepID=A0A2I5HND4_SALDZ|nr:DUF943 family protein [Salmonella enterica]EAA7931270.1 DUF943 family protein [Salmonella enterica subsp. enterica serovar Redlands]ECG1719993.1 DUF943 family protein [Salmonella enterica subsp. diarizonae serovar 17:z10:e,n,x,z15]ECU8750220.1 DUF943 family protein [Salmonella enterica subsp. diarizonae str. CFSAN000558]EDT4350415.1 DUF943 family protein [Salmonella enterica subsp. diarizonae serovar 50:k:z]EDW0435746.1 DUF943 family protein [Salmonella enterica subsp. enterica serovar Lexi